MADPADNDDPFAPTMALDMDDVSQAQASLGSEVGSIDGNAPAPDATIPMSADEAQAFLAQIEAEQAQQQPVEAAPRVSSKGTPIARTVQEQAVTAPPAPRAAAPGGAPTPMSPHPRAATGPAAATSPAAVSPQPGVDTKRGSGILIAAIVVVTLMIVGAIVTFLAVL